MVEQAIEHIGCITDAYVDGLCVVGRELIGEVGVERPSWLSAVLWIDVAGALGLPSHFEALPVGGRGCAVAPVFGERMTRLGIDQLGQSLRIGLVADVPGLQPGQSCVCDTWA